MNDKKIIPGFIWRYAEKSLIQLIDLGVNILLARLLLPEIFGTVALINIFNNVLQVFINCGLGESLIQKKDADDLDFSSVFYFYLLACTLLYIGMFFAAPAIAEFYENTELVSLIRVLSLTLIFSAVKNIQQAYVSRHMLFKRFFFASLAGTVFAAAAALILAYKGFGPWALVALQLLDTLIDSAVLWVTVKWRPKLSFSFERLKTLLSFGSKLLVYELLEKIYENIRSLIIGKIYSPSDLAFFEKGKRYPVTVYSNVITTLNSVLFPVLSREQDNTQKLKELLKRTIRTSTYVMAPLLLGLAACADPAVRIILTEKWVPCVPYLRLFCVIILIQSINSLYIVTIKSLGLGNTLLQINVIEKTFSLIVIFMTMNISVEAIAWGMIGSSVFNVAFTTCLVRKNVGYGYSDLLSDICPSILLAGLMAAAVYCIGFSDLKLWQTLMLQILAGAVLYTGGSFLFRMETPQYLIKTFQGLRRRS